jgi:hypothetical protein
MADRLGDDRLIIRSLLSPAFAWTMTANLEGVISITTRALEMSRKLGDRARERQCLTGLGWTYLEMHSLEMARRMCEQALAMSDVTDTHGEGICLINLTRIEISRRDLAAARRSLNKALAVSRRVRDIRTNWLAMSWAACLAAAAGNRQTAAMLFGASDAMTSKHQLRFEGGDQRFYDQHLQATRESMGEAAFSSQHALGAKLSEDEALGLAESTVPPCGINATRLT